jgi:DNA-binding MarR family transcriptional regulator
MSNTYEFDKALENRIRLQIMSILMINIQIEFSYLKEQLDLSDGNLASHIKMLEKENYISKLKKFINNKPNTTYSATTLGKEAFNNHLKAMESFIKENK